MRLPHFLLALQAVFVVFSLLGYGIFSNSPELLQRFDPGARFYLWAFHGFAVANVLLGGAAVLAEAWRAEHTRIVVPFAAVYAISLLSELGGTTYGIPFGAYSYTDLLGPKWFDKVPLVIPLSWFTMAWPAWVLARGKSKGLAAVLVGAALLVAWDLTLDPAMSGATSYWVWGETGSYYGMPWRNLLGWGVTGLVLLTVLALAAPVPRSSRKFALQAYALNLALPVGLCVLHSFWLAALAGAVTGGAAVAVAWGRRREGAGYAASTVSEASHGRA